MAKIRLPSCKHYEAGERPRGCNVTDEGICPEGCRAYIPDGDRYPTGFDAVMDAVTRTGLVSSVYDSDAGYTALIELLEPDEDIDLCYYGHGKFPTDALVAAARKHNKED